MRVNRKSIARAALAAWLLLCGASVHASAWGLAQLMEQLATVESRRVGYSEVRHIELLGMPLQSSGELIYRAPDYLKKTTVQGGEGSYEIDGELLRIDSGGERRELPLDSHPALAAFVASFRATLAGDLATLQRYYRVTLEGTAEAWRLGLEPTESTMAMVVRRVVIEGSGKRLLQVETMEAGGDRSVMTIRGESD